MIQRPTRDREGDAEFSAHGRKHNVPEKIPRARVDPEAKAVETKPDPPMIEDDPGPGDVEAEETQPKPIRPTLEDARLFRRIVHEGDMVEPREIEETASDGMRAALLSFAAVEWDEDRDKCSRRAKYLEWLSTLPADQAAPVDDALGSKPPETKPSRSSRADAVGGKPRFPLGGPGDEPRSIEELREFIVPHAETLGIYQRGGRYVEPGSAQNPYAVLEMTDDRLRAKLGQRIEFVRETKGDDLKLAKLSPDFIRMFVENGPHRDLPTLESINRFPLIREDGSVSAGVGFDATTRAILLPRDGDDLGGFAKLVESRPGREDAWKAVQAIRALFGEFPWLAEENAFEAFLSLVLTLAARHLIRGSTPGFVFTANVAGSGKTTLARCASMIGGGVRSPTRTYPDESEMGKALLTSALAGDRVVLFDNLPNGDTIQSPSLEQAITSGSVVGRVLSKSEQRQAANRAVFVLTGNNVAPVADSRRRFVVVRLESATADPEKRSGFTIPDIERHVERNAPTLNADVLTILSAYLAAGCPETDGFDRRSDFPEWDRIVRGAVLWVTGREPLLGAEKLGECDETRQEAATVARGVALIAEREIGKRATAAEIARACDDAIGSNQGGAIQEAAEIIKGDRRAPLTATWVGRDLAKYVDMPTAHGILRRRLIDGRSRYQVDPIGGER
ncbi:MAG: hypothetical protein SFX72_13850 [Isosphaeraceae bacterium]|nr:hypothetical protein [Isosphaeraceae bacterium]